jgi:hypothetical protein
MVMPALGVWSALSKVRQLTMPSQASTTISFSWAL